MVQVESAFSASFTITRVTPSSSKSVCGTGTRPTTSAAAAKSAGASGPKYSRPVCA